MKQLNKPKTVLRKFVRYRNELLENVCLAIQEVPALLNRSNGPSDIPAAPDIFLLLSILI